MSNAVLGYSLVVLSMLLYPVTFAFYKVASSHLPNTVIIFFQSLISWMIVIPFALKNGLTHLKTKQFPMIALRTIFGLVSMYCISIAVQSVDLSLVVLFNNTAPLFVPIILWFWFRTKVSLPVWVSLLIGFLGVLLILRPGFETINSGLLFAIASGISSGLLLVATRQIAHEAYFKILFYYFLIFCVILTPFLFGKWTAPSLEIWGFILLAGVTMVGAQYCFTAGMRYVPAHEAAPFIYTGVIFSGLIDWIFWKQVPGLVSIIGMLIVCIGGIMAIYYNRKRSTS